jgi:hypothetical protein
LAALALLGTDQASALAALGQQGGVRAPERRREGELA